MKIPKLLQKMTIRCPVCKQEMPLRYDEHSESWGYVCENCLLIFVVKLEDDDVSVKLNELTGKEDDASGKQVAP